MDRRGAIAGGLALAVIGPAALARVGGSTMYGMIGKMVAKPGQRQALARLLMEGTAAMPGCLSYVIAEDTADADTLWVSEAWDSEASHKASLALPAVRAAIAEARPLIAGFDTAAITRPIGGVGLK